MNGLSITAIACVQFLKDLGLSEENIRLRAHDPEELAHYSNGTSDIEYNFSEPIGWGELWGIADRTDFDLKAHQTTSKQSLEYFDQETNSKYIPYVIEPSVGVERLILAIMCEAYEMQQLENDERLVLHLHPYLAPYKVAVLPLSKKLNDQLPRSSVILLLNLHVLMMMLKVLENVIVVRILSERHSALRLILKPKR